jgi:type IV pilus assembly protein PilW
MKPHSPKTGRPRLPGPPQSGMSLIEILVGIAIGLVVALAAASSLIFVRLSAGTAEDTWRLQQEASTAFRVIGTQLRQAGARPLVAALGSGRVEFAEGYAGFGTPSAPRAITGTNGPNAAPDTLQTSLQNDPAADARDCLGLSAGSLTADIRNRFSLSSTDLSCTGISTGAAFVNGVEDMQVWYGESSAGGTPFQYRAAPLDWGSVTAVMVCLRIAAERTGQITTATVGCNGEPVAADGRLRRTFVRVFRLRNASA